MKLGKLKTGAAIALAGFLFVCIWIVATPCPASQRPLNAPLYIESVWPLSESEIRLGCYVKRYLLPRSGIGVGVAIDMDSIWELELPQPGNEDVSSFPDRVSLYVDEEQVPVTRRWEGGGTYFATVNGKYTELDLAGWYFFGSDRFMWPGDHLAKVVIVTKSGETLKYEWHFKIK